MKRNDTYSLSDKNLVTVFEIQLKVSKIFILFILKKKSEGKK